MLEEESLSDFYTTLGDIANEKVSEFLLVRKIIRLLPDRFQPKTTAIEENKNLDTMRVEELVAPCL